MYGTWSLIIASSYSRFKLCQRKKAIEMLIASKLHCLLAVQLHLLHTVICESPDCKTVYCNISRTLQSLPGQSINLLDFHSFLPYVKNSFLIQFKSWSSLQDRKAQVMPIVEIRNSSLQDTWSIQYHQVGQYQNGKSTCSLRTSAIFN